MKNGHFSKVLKVYNGKMLCPECREPMFIDTFVKMSYMNGYSHINCCATLPDKERGLLRDIIKKHPKFFPLD